MSRVRKLIVVSGLVVGVAWSLFEHAWIDLVQAVSILALLLVVLRMLADRDADRRALRRGAAREQVLGELGTALIHTTDPAEVRRLAVRAVGTLLADCPGARATVLRIDDGAFTVIEAAGAHVDAPCGRSVPAVGAHAATPCGRSVPAVGAHADALCGHTSPAAGVRSGALRGRTAPAVGATAELIDRLLAGEVVIVRNPDDLGCAGLEPAAGCPLTLLPLTGGDRFSGVLAVSAGGELPTDVLPSLRALRTQVALALAGVALTAELTERALRDPLTGLGNRAMLRERIGEALARSKRTGRPVGALLLGLNGFKQVNDLHGHSVGDRLLQAVAERLQECVRAEDTVGRLGGDEFVVITEDLTSARDALTVAGRIVESLGEAIPVGARRLRTAASVGVALSHAGLTGPDDLLRLADAAMYEAKRRGGGFQLHGAPASPPLPPIAQPLSSGV